MGTEQGDHGHSVDERRKLDSEAIQRRIKKRETPEYPEYREKQEIHETERKKLWEEQKEIREEHLKELEKQKLFQLITERMKHKDFEEFSKFISGISNELKIIFNDAQNYYSQQWDFYSNTTDRENARELAEKDERTSMMEQIAKVFSSDPDLQSAVVERVERGRDETTRNDAAQDVDDYFVASGERSYPDHDWQQEAESCYRF